MELRAIDEGRNWNPAQLRAVFAGSKAAHERSTSPDERLFARMSGNCEGYSKAIVGVFHSVAPRSRRRFVAGGGVQIVMLYRLHPWVSSPETIVGAQSGQARVGLQKERPDHEARSRAARARGA
jgi:hypothetical protein